MRHFGRYLGTAAAVALALTLGACSSGAQTQDNDQGDSEVVKAGDIGAFDLKPGNCLVTTSISDSDQVTDVPAVPCTDPHDGEVISSQDVTSVTTYDADAIDNEAYEKCAADFESYVGVAEAASSLTVMWLTPTEQGWNYTKSPDREITCIVVDETGSNLTESVKGKGADYPGSSEDLDAENTSVMDQIKAMPAGTCLSTSAINEAGDGTVPTVDCSQAHDAEVIGTQPLTTPEYSEDGVIDEASTLCTAAFEGYVGIASSSSSLGVDIAYPDQTAWDAGDHAVTCLAYDPSGENLTASVAGTAQ